MAMKQVLSFAARRLFTVGASATGGAAMATGVTGAEAATAAMVVLAFCIEALMRRFLGDD